MSLEELKIDTFDKVLEYIENHNNKYSQFDDEVVREFDEVYVEDIGNIIDTYTREKNNILGIEEEYDNGIDDFFNEEVEEEDFDISQYSFTEEDVTDLLDNVEESEYKEDYETITNADKYVEELNELDKELNLDDEVDDIFKI